MTHARTRCRSAAGPMKDQIYNGDHAAFEAEHAGVPPRDRPDWPLPSFDARDWAEVFCRQFPAVDRALAEAWFANALMRGFDEAAGRQSPRTPSGPT